MRVVFDANVLLSAFLTRDGIAQQLFVRVLADHETLVSEYILREAVEKLSGKLKIPEREVEVFARYIRARMTVIDPSEKAGPIDFEDPKDIPILRLLEAGGVHYFVTGDKKLLGLKKHKQTLILSLREAFELL
ncbi:MAG TPA: putative toxin-antitoxin system toxin component, PIN family [Candidatus Omnitrophota bacterium]|nr:putative toxin-antitoxin system toxin component, PIN family [Candidatus Omnitrophota bacterium]